MIPLAARRRAIRRRPDGTTAELLSQAAELIEMAAFEHAQGRAPEQTAELILISTRLAALSREEEDAVRPLDA
ncbi:MAG: hypothetical protein ACU0BF_06920 [Paracoccaceae bacterium]